MNHGAGREELARIAFIALGSNLGDSVQIIRQAFDCLQQLSGDALLRSSLWETTPVDCPPGSNHFINAVAGLVPQRDETPETLLEKLQQMEKAFGRRPKTVLNEPRPLDLDLIAFGREVRRTKRLVLPHPRAHLRRFVLQPLCEIAPDFVLPEQKQSVQQLLETLRSKEKVRLLAKS